MRSYVSTLQYPEYKLVERIVDKTIPWYKEGNL